jgi:hypothetical protein
MVGVVHLLCEDGGSVPRLIKAILALSLATEASTGCGFLLGVRQVAHL